MPQTELFAGAATIFEEVATNVAGVPVNAGAELVPVNVAGVPEKIGGDAPLFVPAGV